jgi:alanine dehydrogenase
MRVGVPAEVKKHEYRVGLTVSAAREYAAAGNEVYIESGAGRGIGQSDEEYERVGAKILPDAASVFSHSDMIVKVKEPQPSEWKMLREDQILFTYLHLAPDPLQTKGLLDSGCTAVAYETVSGPNGALPLLAPMSEVAGRLSIEAAGQALRRYNGGPGLLLGGVPGVRPSRVVVLGGGVVGTHAAKMAVGLGAEVTVVDRSLPRLRQLDDLFGGRVRTCFSTIDVIEQELVTADVVIGAVLVPGASTPRLVTREMLQLLKPSCVLVDVAIDQGGCFETSRPTTHDDPVYDVDGILHYCVANMPGAVPLTSSVALNNATLPFGLALAAGGKEALLADRALLDGLNVHRGMITKPAVGASLELDWVYAKEALAA